jgi:hypothetical protein
LNPNYIISLSESGTWQNELPSTNIDVLVLLHNPLHKEVLWWNDAEIEAYTMRNIRLVLNQLQEFEVLSNVRSRLALMDLIPFIAPTGGINAAESIWDRLCASQFDLIWKIGPKFIISCGTPVSSRIWKHHSSVLEPSISSDNSTWYRLYQTSSSSNTSTTTQTILACSVPHPSLLFQLHQFYYALATASSLILRNKVFDGILPNTFQSVVRVNAYRYGRIRKLAKVATIEKETSISPFVSVTVDDPDGLFATNHGWITGSSE